MTDINNSLDRVLDLNGALCASIVDSHSGMVLGEAGSGVDMELAAAGNSEVIKSKLKTMGSLGIKSKIEDILITLNSQYHIIRPMEAHEGLFIYLVLDSKKSNLALARREVEQIEKSITL